jgi:hypothetical protein
MAKKQIHIRASERLQQQLQALATGGATITEVVTVAVDRMYMEETVFDIYEKPFNDSFAGTGKEWVIVKNKKIVAHGRAWDESAVVDDKFMPTLVGQPVTALGNGWCKLIGFARENAQAWAADMAAFA